MGKKKAKKKVAKKKVTKKAVKSVEVKYSYIDKEGENIYLKAHVYNKIMTSHSNEVLLKKDKELLGMKKTMLEHEKQKTIEQYDKAIKENISTSKDIDEKIKEKKIQYKEQLKRIQIELGSENQAFSIVDEDTYKIMLEN